MKDLVMIHGVEYVPKVIAPEPVKVGRWKPVDGEMFWSFDCDGDTFDMQWIDGEYDERFKMGNVYRTSALATHARDKQLLLVELQDFADRANEGRATMVSVDKIWHLCRGANGSWQINSSRVTIQGAICFIIYTDANAAIVHFWDRLNLLLN